MLAATDSKLTQDIGILHLDNNSLDLEVGGDAFQQDLVPIRFV